MTRDVGDTNLISTADAAALSGYSKDYIGQLCREGKVECQRVSGQWQIDKDALQAYQAGERDAAAKQSEDESLTLYTSKTGNVRSDTFTYDGIEYISTGRAADLTGYTQDYVGQLARGGEVEARRVGRRWFVGRKSLTSHKKENDDALAQVQAESSGFAKSDTSVETTSEYTERSSSGSDIHFNVRYISESDQATIAPLPARTPTPIRKVAAPVSQKTAAIQPEGLKEPEMQPLQPRTPAAVPSSFDGMMPKKEQKLAKVGLKTVSRISEIEKRGGDMAKMETKKQKKSPRRPFSLGVMVTLFLLLLTIGALVFFALKFDQGELGNVRSIKDVREYFEENIGPYVPGKSVEYTSVK